MPIVQGIVYSMKMAKVFLGMLIRDHILVEVHDKKTRRKGVIILSYTWMDA